MWVGVAVLGGVGACGRFLLDSVVAASATGDFPFGTLAVNASGALAGTATLGSYTTFSTWMLETHRLAEDGETPTAVANVVASLAVGIGAAALGRLIGAHV